MSSLLLKINEKPSILLFLCKRESSISFYLSFLCKRESSSSILSFPCNYFVIPVKTGIHFSFCLLFPWKRESSISFYLSFPCKRESIIPIYNIDSCFRRNDSLLSFPSSRKRGKREFNSSILSFPSSRKRGKRESSIYICNIDSCFCRMMACMIFSETSL